MLMIGRVEGYLLWLIAAGRLKGDNLRLHDALPVARVLLRSAEGADEHEALQDGEA